MLVEEHTSTVTMEISIENSQKQKLNLSSDPAKQFSAYMFPKDATSYSTHAYSAMVIATLALIARKWKYCNHPSHDKWIMKTWYTPTGKYWAVSGWNCVDGELMGKSDCHRDGNPLTVPFHI